MKTYAFTNHVETVLFAKQWEPNQKDLANGFPSSLLPVPLWHNLKSWGHNVPSLCLHCNIGLYIVDLLRTLLKVPGIIVSS